MRLVSRLLQPVLTILPPLLGLTVLAAGLAISERFRDRTPVPVEVGAMVRFHPNPRAATLPGPALTLQATRLSGTGLAARDTAEACRFETEQLLTTAGSMVVVAVEPGGEAVHVHWVGGPTAAEGGCGVDAALRLDLHSYVTLRTLADFGLPVLPPPMLP